MGAVWKGSADLFLPARHKFLDFVLQFFVQPVIMLPHVLHLLVQSTPTMLITANKTVLSATRENCQKAFKSTTKLISCVRKLAGTTKSATVTLTGSLLSNHHRHHHELSSPSKCWDFTR